MFYYLQKKEDVMYLYEMTWIELYVNTSCPVCNK